MKKPFQIIALSLLSMISIMGVLFLLMRFVFREQSLDFLKEIQYKERLKVLRTCGPYTNSPKPDFHFTYKQDSGYVDSIRDYFRLDTLLNPEATTWENAVTLANFIVRNIPHANQRIQPLAYNAIDLWKYHLLTEPAFNCRLHAIMLHELLLASGITNRFVTCLPADSTDPDCHVVNLVWLPERQKWAMIDSDGCAFVADEKGVPLSLEEMRQFSIEGKRMEVHPIEGGEMYEDYLSYWAKNLYWFICWEETGYNKEPDRKGRQIYLLPQGFEGFYLWDNAIITSDATRFWAAPEETLPASGR